MRKGKNMRQHTALLLLLPLFAVAANTSLENQYLKLQVNPAGGRISSLTYLPSGREMTSGEGLLGDKFYHVPEANNFLTELPYNITDGENSIALQANHTGGGINFMDITKTVTIKPDSGAFSVKYRFHNLPAAMSAVDYGFWSQNFIGKGNEPLKVFFPCINGINSIYTRSAGQQFAYYKQPSRGFMGYTFPSGGGMAVTMDYKLLDQFYGWYGKNETTAEFYFSKFKLDADKELVTELEFIPFHTLKKLSGAGGGLAGELNIREMGDRNRARTFELDLYSASVQKVKLEYFARRLRDGEPEKFASQEVVFDTPCTVKKIKLAHEFKQFPALFDIEIQAVAPDGKVLARFNAPAGLGTGTVAYRMKPETERPGKNTGMIDLQKFTPAENCGRIKWAKPLAGGKIRLLALTPYPAFREVLELADSIDIELFSTLFVAQGRPANSTGDHFGLLTEADISGNIDELLQKDYDVILLAGINFDKLTSAQRSEILNKVKSGCGLILIDCNGKNSEISAVSPLQKTGHRNYPGNPPRRKNSHFITCALPWYLFPSCVSTPYNSTGEVLAVTGSYPYLAVNKYGKGNVAAFSWITSAGPGRMVSGVTPARPYPLENAAYKEFRELWQLLLGKVIVSAAGRDGGISFGDVSATRNAGTYIVNVSFKNIPASTEEMTLELFSRSRENQELSRKEFKFTPKEKMTFKFPAEPWNGQQLIGFILRNSRGETVDFGAVSATRLPMARMHSLSADKKSCREGDTVKFTMKAAVDKPAFMRWTLFDAFNRAVAQGRIKAQPSMTVALPMKSTLKSRFFTFAAEMEFEGKTVDRHTVKIRVTPAPEKLVWDDFEPGIWITPYSYDSVVPSLYPRFAEALRAMKMVNIMGNSRMIDHDFAVDHNFNPTIYRSGGTAPSKVNKEFHRTGDKMLLTRTPCLSDSAFRSKMSGVFSALGRENRDKGIRFYWFGDELSLTGYWSSAVDFCFSPACLANFAKFMERKYGTVENANRQWGTQYSSFTEFIPETAAEARRRKDGNCSAWADHLEFMDSLLCDYIRHFSDKGLKSGDPAARSFISGPQAPSAYGGNDWSMQSQIYSGLMSYSFGGLPDILHSFNPEIIDLPWVLGYANYDGKVCYELWKALQYGARGAMGFSAASMIRPDYTLSRSGQTAAQYLPEIVSGTGKLVLNTLNKRPAPEVLIVYSQSSIRGAFITGGAKKHEKLRTKYIDLCRNFGISFKFISDVEIANGALKNTSAKLLILPDINAVSDQTLTALDEYTGQRLTAGKFAVMDGSCRKLNRRAAQESVADDRFSDIFAKQSTARSPEEQELLDNEREVFAQVLKKSGIIPLFSLEKEDGTPYLEGELTVMQDTHGNLFVLAVTKEENPVKINLKSPRTGWLCNIRRTSGDFRDSNPVFAALLPEAEEHAELKISVAENVFSVENSTGRDTVYRITVKSPDGQTVDHYCANVTAPDGKGVYKLALALNDQPGPWQIEAKDIVTGKTAKGVLNR